MEPQRGSGMQPKGVEPGRGSLGISEVVSPSRSLDRNAVPSGAWRDRGGVRMTEPQWGSTGGGDRGVDAGSQESARYRSALLGCMTQARWAWENRAEPEKESFSPVDPRTTYCRAAFAMNGV